jgi:hypothetical protein
MFLKKIRFHLQTYKNRLNINTIISKFHKQKFTQTKMKNIMLENKTDLIFIGVLNFLASKQLQSSLVPILLTFTIFLCPSGT